MEEFRIINGRCSVTDDVLVIDRPDVSEMNRLDVFRMGVSTYARYRPWLTAVWLGGILILGLVFVLLLAYIYTSNPAVAPLVGILALSGILAVGVPLETSYRRAMRQYQSFQDRLADDVTLARPDRIPLADIAGITVQIVSVPHIVPFASGTGILFLVHFQREGSDAATHLGFREFMADEITTAQTAFERHGIPIEDTAQLTSAGEETPLAPLKE